MMNIYSAFFLVLVFVFGMYFIFCYDLVNRKENNSNNMYFYLFTAIAYLFLYLIYLIAKQ